MPRRSAASAARSSEAMSPCVAGISTGTAAVSAAISRVCSVRLRRKSAPAAPPRRNSAASAESTLTRKPAAFSARTASSRCGNGVSGRQPRSITSAPAAAIAVARATIASTSSAEASTISAKMRMSWRVRSSPRPRLPKWPADPSTRPARARTARRTRRSGVRGRRGSGPAPRPGRPATGRASRRVMIASVISAATFTPMSTIDQSRPKPPASFNSFSSRARARCPVRKRTRSAMRVVACAAPPPRSTRSSVSTTCVSSKDLRRSVLSRSMRRG